MNAEQIGYQMGYFCGIFFGAFLTMLFISVLIRKKKKKGGTFEFDERQQLIRFKGYQYGFYVMLIAGLLACILLSSDIKLPLSHVQILFAVVFMGAYTQVMYCIFHHAYFKQNEKTINYILLFLVAGIIQISECIRRYQDDASIQAITIQAFCGIFFLSIPVAVFIRKKLPDNLDEE